MYDFAIFDAGSKLQTQVVAGMAAAVSGPRVFGELESVAQPVRK